MVNPPVSTKNTKISQAWWCMPVIPATQQAEAGGSLEPGEVDCSEPRYRDCLGKKGRKERERERERERDRETERERQIDRETERKTQLFDRDSGSHHLSQGAYLVS